MLHLASASSLPPPSSWGNIPLDDALQFGHSAVVKVLQDYQVACQEQERLPVADTIPIAPKLETVEGMV